MQLLFFCPRWGYASITWDVFLHQVKNAGYHGVEAGLQDSEDKNAEMQSGIEKYGLDLIGQHWETTSPDFEIHYKELELKLLGLSRLKPLFINSQTGKDYFSPGQNKKLISLATDISNETGIQILHETHRGKFSFAAHITKQYLEEIPELRLTLDISHWCNTAESLLDDQAEAVQLAISRTDHIHARVGFPQGPQVPDPRNPAWKEAFDFHVSCWDKIIEIKKQEGKDITITPEFGPSPYMVNVPFTNDPLADQWEINLFMMNFLRERYSR